MNQIETVQEACALVDKTTVSDGEGGFVTAWKDGAQFMAAIVLESAVTAVIAEMQQGIKKIYYVTTQKNAMLHKGNVFRRESNGQTFRVTSDGPDVQTPPNSEMSFSQVTAEEWALPLDGSMV